MSLLSRTSADEDTGDREFMQRRVQELLGNSRNYKPWVREGSNQLHASFHVVVPEDGEDHWEPLILKKLPSGDYVLTHHNTGIIQGHSKLTSGEYNPLKELGERLFGA